MPRIATGSTVTVNDTKVAELAVQGSSESRAIAVPVKALKAGDSNRVGLAMEGRGTFSYAVTMTGFTRDFGPDQDRANRPAWVDRRVYWPAPAELDGKALPAGFGVAVNPSTFENVATQVALGGKARVGLTVWRNIPATTPEWERDFLVVEEHLPAGTTLIEGSVQTSASSFTLADGVLTFYFHPDQNPGGIQYDVYGYLPGQYRTLPATVKSAYEPGQFHLGQPGDFKVLAPGEKNTDPYRQSPDELYARGKAHFDAGRYAESAAALEPLFAGYTLRDDVAKDAARMLLLISIKDYEPRKVVQYFEVVKEKAPELILSFDQLLVDRPGLSRHQRVRAGDHRLARADRGQLPRGRAGRRAAAPARQDARGDDLPDRPLADLPQHAPRSRATSSASPRFWHRRRPMHSPTPTSAVSWPPRE